MDLNLEVSILDYEYPILSGIGVYFSVNLEEHKFNGLYWLDKTLEPFVSIDKNFLKLFSVESVDSLPFYENFLIEIESNLNMEELIKMIID